MEKATNKKLVTGIVAGVIVGLITLFAAIIIFFILVFFGGPAKVTKDVSDYDEVMHKYENIQTGFAVFPENIAQDAEVFKFYFSYQDTWDDPTCEVFLQCSYTSEDYEKEVERLEQVERIYGDDVKRLLKEEKGRFHYPAYIAIDNHNYGYEYALLSGEREITYVYTAFKERDNIHFDEIYLPSDYGEEKVKAVLKGYCLYEDSALSDDDGWVYEYK